MNAAAKHTPPLADALRAPITTPELLRLVQINADLLAALRDVCEWLDSVPLGSNARQSLAQARAAIARAEGTP